MYCEGLQELRLGRQFTEFSPMAFKTTMTQLSLHSFYKAISFIAHRKRSILFEGSSCVRSTQN